MKIFLALNFGGEGLKTYVCSNSFSCGTRDPRLVEPQGTRKASLRHTNTVSLGRTYSVQWKRSRIDIAELASKRFIEDWKVKDLCAHFGCGRNTIECAYQKLRRQKFVHKAISPELRTNLLKAVEK